MDLDSRAYSNIFGISYNDINYEEYKRIVEAICPLTKRCDYKIPEI